MPPDATQNLNAKLSGPRPEGSARPGTVIRETPPIQSSAPPIRIVGAAAPYRGGYRVER